VSRASGRGALGATLLEVAIALGVMAMCGLGLVSTQLGLARHAQQAAARTHATFAADALAEAARVAAPGVTGAVADRWKALAAGIVPEGRLATSSAGGGATLATVTWLAAAHVAASGVTAVSSTASCIDVVVPSGHNCVAVAFLR
jgi:Tfp pilus assembly protein PilV